MQSKESSIEVKVGALVLFSLSLLVAFVLVLGDFSFSDGFQFHVDFENAGGLKPGANVAIAGMNVGTIERLKFQSNEGADDGSDAVAVRATLRVDEDYADAVRTSSEFFISTQGLLGEPYIEIETRSFDAPQVEAGAILKGEDPARMDVIISKAGRLLDTVYEMLQDPEVAAGELLGNAASLMGHLDEALVDNREDIDGTIQNARLTSEEAAKLLAAINFAVEDGESLRGMLDDSRATTAHARRISSKLDSEFDPLLDDASTTTENARRITESVDRILNDNEAKISTSMDNVEASTEHIASASRDASEVVGRVEDGHGTVGQLLADREMYDDMKELLRTIKRQPWKIIWKE